jgi:hypothetical protein
VSRSHAFRCSASCNLQPSSIAFITL